MGCQNTEYKDRLQLNCISSKMMYNRDSLNTIPNNITDKDGKPLLSWRVYLLRYGTPEELHLYKQFHLDEPWNSPHNLKVAQTVPYYYLDPKGPKCANVPANKSDTILMRMDPQKKNYTPYLGVAGTTAAFRPGKPRQIDKKDQRAAIMVVEKSDVLWSEPRDIPLEQAKKGDTLRWYGNETQYLDACETPKLWKKDIASGKWEGQPKFEYEADE